MNTLLPRILDRQFIYLVLFDLFNNSSKSGNLKNQLFHVYSLEFVEELFCRESDIDRWAVFIKLHQLVDAVLMVTSASHKVDDSRYVFLKVEMLHCGARKV